MNWCDEKLGLIGGDDANALSHEVVGARLAAVPVNDLVRAWREVATTGLREQTSGTYSFHMYFDRLGYHEPIRAAAFVIAEAALERDDAMAALVAQEKLLGQLLHFRAAEVIDELELAAAFSPRLSWLLGGVAISVRGGIQDKALVRRMLAITDEPAYRDWERRYRDSVPIMDFAALSIEELARAWIEITTRSPLARERDRNASALFDVQHDLVNEQPERALALVREVLRIEENPKVLAVLAAGLLEDLIPNEWSPLLDSVEAEARSSPRFRHLLGGVWYSSRSPAVVQRLERVTDRSGW